MVTKAAPKTREQRLQERFQEIDAIRQMQAAHEARRAEKQKAQDDFLATVQARHDRVDSFIRHSWAQRSDEPMSPAQFAAARAEIEQEAYSQIKVSIPTMGELYQQKRAEELAAAEEAERQRIAAMTERDKWVEMVRITDPVLYNRIQKYEAINHMPWSGAPV